MGEEGECQCSSIQGAELLVLPISLLMSQLSQGSDPSQMATKELRAGILIGSGEFRRVQRALRSVAGARRMCILERAP